MPCGLCHHSLSEYPWGESSSVGSFCCRHRSNCWLEWQKHASPGSENRWCYWCLCNVKVVYRKQKCNSRIIEIANAEYNYQYIKWILELSKIKWSLYPESYFKLFISNKSHFSITRLRIENWLILVILKYEFLLDNTCSFMIDNYCSIRSHTCKHMKASRLAH